MNTISKFLLRNKLTLIRLFKKGEIHRDFRFLAELQLFLIQQMEKLKKKKWTNL